jgi:hypothetical protein
VLADGVAYAAKDLHCDVVLDMATLTGAQGISHGRYHAAHLSNAPSWEAALTAAGSLSGDLCFPSVTRGGEAVNYNPVSDLLPRVPFPRVHQRRGGHEEQRGGPQQRPAEVMQALPSSVLLQSQSLHHQSSPILKSYLSPSVMLCPPAVPASSSWPTWASTGPASGCMSTWPRPRLW